MKTSITSWVLTLFLAVVAPVQAQTRIPSPAPSAAYVSDRVEVPLRAGTSNRYKVIGSVNNGSRVEVLKVDKAKGYTQIRTPAGVKGWIQSAQLTDTPGSQEQLAGVRQQLERLQTQHSDLKQHVDNVVSRPEGEDLSYPQLYEEALRLRQQLAQYRKVASDTVAIDERNKVLQERVVTLERELQVVQQENQALRDDNGNIRFLIGALLLGVALLAAVLTPKIREQRRTQWSQL
ncbi:MAG TPA: TIGR04211 family SH3 domain-containing protein [Candidatus Competibacteraceae bacterium]|nr:TIGR04211 family SH3 domain-containing protein [Candidatus Competibacteraceae bacterium]HRZ05864.1 TIGR04211 family SH3 domain-containing protein [Candidatus Competibacteraceae bacterium]HSA45633.1 TIGR04211 family SH3 domain-containing protein [Candidatus Competibacteraceae bacterium]